jgi:flagellar assembly protein FliH
MAARFKFDLRFDDAAERVAACDAMLPWRGASHYGAAAPFEFPRLQPAGEPESDAGSAPAAKSFSQAELDAALAAARAEAAAATEACLRAELEAAITARQSHALERIAAGLTTLQATLEQALAARAAASRDLALALARALVPRALERQPLADIEAMLRDLLVRLEGQPAMTLALPPALLDAGQQTLGTIAAKVGYRGELTIEPDPTLGPGDARLAWRGGRAERDLVELKRAATALVDAWLPASAAEPWPIEGVDAGMDGAML